MTRLNWHKISQQNLMSARGTITIADEKREQRRTARMRKRQARLRRKRNKYSRITRDGMATRFCSSSCSIYQQRSRSGPHWASLRCRSHGWIRWLPQAESDRLSGIVPISAPFDTSTNK